MATAIDVVRAAFAALDAGDMESATAAFAPSLVYRLHGDHPLAGEFDGKTAALGALARLAQAGGADTTLRLADAWPAGPELVVAHLVRRTGAGGGPVESDVATILRVEDGEHHGDRERLVPRTRRSLGGGLDRRRAALMPRAWWSLDTLVVEHQVGSEGLPVVLEQTLPAGAAPPLHRHHHYDDNWYLLEGTIVVRCGDDVSVANPGSFVRTPAGTLHQFRVVGDRPARILVVHASDHFYEFLRALAVPAERLELPEPTGGPGIDALTAAAAAHDTEIVGPSMTGDEAAAILERSAGEDRADADGLRGSGC